MGGVRPKLSITAAYNYLSAMKAATHNANFESLIATLRSAQRYTARIGFTSRATAEARGLPVIPAGACAAVL